MHQKLKRSLHLWKLLLLILFLLAGSCVSRQGKLIAVSNDGDTILKSKCLVCHESDLIKQQRLSKAGWTKEVEKMIRWGSTVTDAEKDVLIGFLAASFGPRPLLPAAPPTPAPAAASVEAGKKVYEARCMICHEKELVAQQRLGRTGWTKEVEKMIRWGAEVTDSEKESLIDYLSVNHPPRKQ